MSANVYRISPPFRVKQLINVSVADVVDEGEPVFTFSECVYAVGDSVDLREFAPDDIALNVFHATFTCYVKSVISCYFHFFDYSSFNLSLFAYATKACPTVQRLQFPPSQRYGISYSFSNLLRRYNPGLSLIRILHTHIHGLSASSLS